MNSRTLKKLDHRFELLDRAARDLDRAGWADSDIWTVLKPVTKELAGWERIGPGPPELFEHSAYEAAARMILDAGR